MKAGLLLQRYTAWNAEIYEIYYGVSQDGIIRGITADGRNLFLPEKWSSSGRYLHQEDLGYLTFTHTLSPRTFYEIRIARSRTLQDTIGVHPWSGEPRRDRDDWFNTGRQVAMWVASERERHILKADLSSQVSGGHMVRAGFEIVRYNSWYTYWGGRSKQDNAFTFYAGGDRPWEMGNPASPIRGALYVQDKMEFEGLVVNAGLRVDLQKHTHRELIQPGFVWAPMWRVYAHRQFGYGVGTAEGAALRNDFAQTPPTAIHVSPRVGVSHPVGGRCALHFSLGRFIQWADLSSMYAESYSNLPRMGTGGSTTWWDANGNGVEDPAERLNLMQPAYAGLSGNPWARPEETLTFEIGVDWSFVADYVGSLTVYYRSETQQHHPDGVHWLGPKRGVSFSKGLGNLVAAYVKGVELTVTRRLTDCVAFRAGWSTQFSARGRMGIGQHGASVVPDSAFVVSSAFWYAFRANPDGSESPSAFVGGREGGIWRLRTELCPHVDRQIQEFPLDTFRNHPRIQ